MGSGGASRGLGGREEDGRLWRPHWNPVRAEVVSLDAGQPFQERTILHFFKLSYCHFLLSTYFMRNKL